MARAFLLLVAVAAAVVAVTAFGSGEDKFIKKYAMMKIYESCFGPEVVKQIRKEMKAACAKCAALEAPAPPPPAPARVPSMPSGAMDKDGIVTDSENTLYANQQTFDADKLHQAILAYRPNPFAVPSYRPYHPQNYFNAPNPMYYPGAGYQSPNPFAASPYAYPYFAQQFLGSSRVSRDMDIKSQLEALTSRVSGRVKNVTCVMQELGYLDDNLEPNFEKISERIGNLPVSDELRKDMQEGVTFCQQFSQCVPEIKKDRSPLSRELIRPMFFFKCYKHKKLEACIMKDVREKYAGVSEDEFDGDVEFRRTGKSARLPDAEVDDMAASMYEFLYGSDSNIDIDSLL